MSEKARLTPDKVVDIVEPRSVDVMAVNTLAGAKPTSHSALSGLQRSGRDRSTSGNSTTAGSGMMYSSPSAMLCERHEQSGCRSSASTSLSAGTRGNNFEFDAQNYEFFENFVNLFTKFDKLIYFYSLIEFF